MSDPLSISAPANPLAATTHPDPYPWYRGLALHRPFGWDPAIGMWVAAGPEQVDAVLHHPACRVRPPDEPVPRALDGTEAGTVYGRWARMNDGERHARLKAPLQQALANVDLARAREVAHGFAGALVGDDASAAGVNHAMVAVPVLTVAALLGVIAPGGAGMHPHGKRHLAAGIFPDIASDIAADIAAFARAMSPLADADTVTAGTAAAMRCANVVASGARSEWALGLLARCRADGIAADVATANLTGLLIQSCEATAGLIGNTLLALARAGSADGTSLPARIARVLHVDPPIQNTRRFVARDCAIHGTPVRQGDVVLVLLAAAAVARGEPSGASATFGAGPHRCPGAALAGVLAEGTIAGLLASGVDPSRLAQCYRYRPSHNARMPEFL